MAWDAERVTFQDSSFAGASAELFDGRRCSPGGRGEWPVGGIGWLGAVAESLRSGVKLLGAPASRFGFPAIGLILLPGGFDLKPGRIVTRFPALPVRRSVRRGNRGA